MFNLRGRTRVGRTLSPEAKNPKFNTGSSPGVRRAWTARCIRGSYRSWQSVARQRMYSTRAAGTKAARYAGISRAYPEPIVAKVLCWKCCAKASTPPARAS